MRSMRCCGLRWTGPGWLLRESGGGGRWTVSSRGRGWAGGEGHSAIQEMPGAAEPARPGSGRLFIVGLGPGAAELLTGQARAALAAADVVVGYRGYLEQAGQLLKGKRLQVGELGGE